MKCEICGKDILKDSQCIDYKYYHNDCIINLIKENQELKKQLEENKHKGLYNTCLPYSTGYNKAIKEKENQQKDFIKYLEDEFTKIQNDIEKEIDNNVKYFKVERRQAIAKILQKYKEIIGVSDEKEN